MKVDHRRFKGGQGGVWWRATADGEMGYGDTPQEAEKQLQWSGSPHVKRELMKKVLLAKKDKQS